MAESLPDLRAALRALLLDTATPTVWPDAALDACLWEAVAAHSYRFPCEATLLFDVGESATTFLLGAGDGLDSVTPMTSGADLIAVQRVDLPVGTPIPEDPRPITDPSGTASPAPGQAYRWRGGSLTLRRPATGAEVGPGRLRVETLQTYQRPSADGAVLWNGPLSDRSLVLLLAQRGAYGLLAAWQARDPALLGAAPPTGHAADLPGALAALDAEIARAVAARRARAVRSRPLDV
jgi:hypothetical protein